VVKLLDDEICFHRRTTVNPWTQMLKGKMNNWFEVDRQGLAQILERKGKEFALFELIQNGWDEPGVTKVTVSLVQRLDSRIIGHEYSGDHLSSDYHDALCRFGARMFSLARRREL